MTTRPSRRLALVLAASLGLNLFLGGMMASQWLFHGPPFSAHPRGAHSPGPFDRKAARAALDEEYRAVVDEIWERNRPSLRQGVRGLRQGREAVKRQLLADAFDPEALKRAHEDLAERMQSMRGVIEAHVLEIAEVLPADQRRLYFEASLRGRSGRLGAFGDPPDHPPR